MKLIYILTTLFLLVLSGCSSNTNSNTDLELDSLKGEYNVVREFDIDMSNFAYSKKVITVESGVKVRIKLTNSNGFHNFIIDDLNIKSDVLSIADTEYIEFIAINKGAYVYYSAISDDKVKGMIGTLYIE
ncbi:MAG: cupredoxin domain-containing protein [Nanoarchaeales archaeon]|nr:cupredoxin domain-containing protein [Nanoarchaeales archaeon]